ncbi:MAG: carboxypeptidase regulatory-like domain-containing protein [Solirubrobacterales bacterium]|nr:carboxypeptidase regulatory-like domain-containing protein [Solirubrobacterales bacterium]
MKKGLGGKLARMAGTGAVALVTLILIGTPAKAGDYVVAQCAPGLNAGTEARFSSSSNHFKGIQECGRNAPGVQIRHQLAAGETGTVHRRFGAWVWTAPPGTVISGGSTRSRLENANGVSGYLVVSPDTGNSAVTENQNDGNQHLSAIPAGRWRYFVARLECTAPNEGDRCVGAASDAHTYVKQIRLRLTDLSSPVLSVGGSLLEGGVRRGRQTLGLIASDQGAGLKSTRITVNGVQAAGEDLGSSCHPLPGALTSSLSPCPKGIGKVYTLDTAAPPFRHGNNKVEICVFDYAQTGMPNFDCESRQVLVDSLCPASPVGGGKKLRARFAGSGKRFARLKFGTATIIRGRLGDGNGNPIVGAQVCVQVRTDAPNRRFKLLATTATNSDGHFSYKLKRGASRKIRVVYRDGSFQMSRSLRLKVKGTSTLRVSRHRTRPLKRVRFFGKIPGPHAAGRVVVVYGTVPGAKKRFLVRRAKTNAVGRWRAAYSFTPVPAKTRFVFWAVVPNQNGYPYTQGRSAARYIRVRP